MSQVHLEVLERVTQGVEALGFGCQGIIESPLKGDRSGNTEFLAHFVRYGALSPCRWLSLWLLILRARIYPDVFLKGDLSVHDVTIIQGGECGLFKDMFNLRLFSSMTALLRIKALQASHWPATNVRWPFNHH